MKKYFLYSILAAVLCAGVYGVFEARRSFAAPAIKQEPAITLNSVEKDSIKSESTSASLNAIEVSPLEIVKNPKSYLNKTIKMKASFDKFSTLGLDYEPAMRKAEDYIGVLIRRDDVADHVVPLSEMKLFMKRKTAEKFIDLESGDIVEIEGKVFSTALSDPWIDIINLTVISSKKPIKAS